MSDNGIPLARDGDTYTHIQARGEEYVEHSCMVKDPISTYPGLCKQAQTSILKSQIWCHFTSEDKKQIFVEIFASIGSSNNAWKMLGTEKQEEITTTTRNTLSRHRAK